MARKCAKGGWKAKRGRPVEPDSLRQSGVMLRVRMPAELFRKVIKRAGASGLSAVVRQFLKQYAAGD